MQRVENVPVFANKPVFDFCGVKIIDEKTGTIEVPKAWGMSRVTIPVEDQTLTFFKDNNETMLHIQHDVASTCLDGRAAFWIPTEGNEKLLQAMGATIVLNNFVTFPTGWTVRRFKELPDVDEIYTNHGEYKYRVFRDSGHMYVAEMTKMLAVSDILRIVTVPTKNNELFCDEHKIKIVEKNRVQLPVGWSVKRAGGVHSNVGNYEIWNNENKLVKSLKDTIQNDEMEDVLTRGGGVHQRLADKKQAAQTAIPPPPTAPPTKEALTFEYRLNVQFGMSSKAPNEQEFMFVRKITEIFEKEGLKGHVVFNFQ